MVKLLLASALISTSAFAGSLIQGTVKNVRVYGGGDALKIQLTGSSFSDNTCSSDHNFVIIRGSPDYVKQSLSVALAALTTGIPVYGWWDGSSCYNINANYPVLGDLAIGQ